MNILMLEDDPAIAQGLRYSLESEGYTVTHCATVTQALEAVGAGRFDLCLLDLTLPDGSGYDVCKAIKAKDDTPVIFLTAFDDEVNVVMGLELGADDYISKPFRLRELMARIKTVLRRSKGAATEEIRISGLTVRMKEGKVLKNGQEVILTALEYKLLLTFLQNRGRVLSRNMLLESIWDVLFRSALTAGISRAAKINRILLPAALQWLGEGQNPDMGLLNWRKLEEHFGTDSEYLGFLRDSPSAAQRLCHILSNSRFLGDALNKSVESVTWLGSDNDLQPRSRESLDVQTHASLERNAGSINDFANSIRAMRRHEIERIGLGWMSGVIDDKASLAGMTDVYDAAIDASLTWAIRHQTQEMGLDEAPAAIAVIGMGRYGGREVNFSSDADVIIIYRPSDNADDNQANLFARKVQEDLRAILQGPTTLEPKIELDMDLRPEGKNGPLVRSYASCEEYYRSWASTWEHQALLRARYAAGDAALAEDFLMNVADPLRYPKIDLTEAQVAEIRKLKARMEAERLPRGVRRDRHLKLGKGGLSDVEWTIQLLQLQHAGDNANLRVNGTMQALDELERRKLVSAGDAVVLRRAWWMCTAARNGSYLWSGRVNQADILPDDTYSLGGLAVYLGYDANRGQHFENDLLAVMRKARDVTERLFYGLS